MEITEAKNLLDSLQNIAEPSFKEYKTTKFICDFLENIGIKNYKNFNPGVIGELNTNKNITIAVRADIDSLPLDKKGNKYKHLCGHHAHTSILLGFLKWASSNLDKLKYNIRFIFQPAEEIGKGAKFIIRNGGIDKVDKIYGLHVDPNLNIGEIGIKNGVLFAGAKFFKLELIGKSTHAALPHNGIDIFVVFADFIFKLQTIISRFKDPIKSGVISIGMVNGGEAHNIIPEKLEVMGTYRFFDIEMDDFINKKIVSALESLKNFYGIEYKIEFPSSSVPLINNMEIVETAKDILKKYGFFKIIEDIDPMLGSEDFSFYTEKIPGIFFNLGIKKGDYHPPLHNKNFFVPEESVVYGIELWKQLFTS